MRLKLLLCALCAAAVDAIFVLVGDDRPQCFLVEEPQQTAVEVKFDKKWASDSPTPAMSFVVEAPLEGLELTEGTETQIVYEKLHEEGSGVITFSTKVDGVHRGCFQLKQAPPQAVALTVQLRTGHSDKYYKELAEKENMNALEIMSLRLDEDLTAVISEADYMKGREVDFHAVSEGINSDSSWWPVFQIVTLLVTGVCQVRYLKNFFKSKKLV